jgi:hypothetical protein
MCSIPSSNTPTIGPALIELLEAQKWNDEVISWPHLEGYAKSLAELQQLDGQKPVVWPIDAAAERLAGAAALLGGRNFRIRGWGEVVEGERVLLVAVVLLSPLPLIWASRQARAQGASSISACGVHIGGMEKKREDLDDVMVIHPDASPRRRSA